MDADGSTLNKPKIFNDESLASEYAKAFYQLCLAATVAQILLQNKYEDFNVREQQSNKISDVMTRHRMHECNKQRAQICHDRAYGIFTEAFERFKQHTPDRVGNTLLLIAEHARQGFKYGTALKGITNRTVLLKEAKDDIVDWLRQCEYPHDQRRFLDQDEWDELILHLNHIRHNLKMRPEATVDLIAFNRLQVN